MTSNITPEAFVEPHDARGKQFIEALRDRLAWPARLVTYREEVVDDSNEFAHWGIALGSTVRRLHFALTDSEDSPEISIEQIVMPEDLAYEAGFGKFQQQLGQYNAVKGTSTLDFEWFSGIGDVQADLEPYIAEAIGQLDHHLFNLRPYA